MEGYYLNVAKINHFICTGKIKLDGAVKGIIAPEMYEIDPDTICQYTGLTDKNGKKIWENDMLGHMFNRVEFVDGAYCINGDRPLCFMAKDCKVIGNIFDNPELLEVE